MLHHKRLKPPDKDYPPNEWSVIEKSFCEDFSAQMESVLALGNGYLGMRGSPDEGGPSVQNATFINGFYESWPIAYAEQAYGFARTGQTMLNVTDSKTIRLIVDDEPFWLPTANLRHYQRKLNMKAGTLDREVLWETPSGIQVWIKSRRLISFRQRHVAAVSYEVTLLNAAAPVVISSEMFAPQPGEQQGEEDPRQSKFLGNVLRHRASYAEERRIVLIHGTDETRMILACAMDHDLESDCPYSSKTDYGDDYGQVVFTVDAQAGCAIHLTKYIAYHTSVTATTKEIARRAEWTLHRVARQGFSKLSAEQEQYLDDFWRRSDVRVSNINTERMRLSTIEMQQAIRLNLFHILQASARAENNGVAAKGLTGQAYEGHYFWDTEIYLLPFLIYTSPQTAKNLLRFRYNMLNQARARARELSHPGALFPWRTISGEEASAYYAAGTAQYHINADIAYGLRKYVNVTGDEEFLFTYGAEMLVETARLWYDLGFFSGRKGGQFCINGVTGPDEYKTVVNNNTYTNLMARENLRFAVETIEMLQTRKPEVLEALILKTHLDLQEVQAWKRAADKMYVPWDAATGIYPQDDSFLDRQPWDFENTSPDRYPLLLSFHPLNIYRHQVIKQADVILAMFLLGHEFSLEAKKRNFAFYDPLTTGDSSLSSCIEAIVALEIGEYDKAVEYARAALLMDLADVGGNVKDGCHIASMGGTWMVFAYGFGGLRDCDGTLSFRPQRPPEAQSTLRFPLTWRGQIVDVEIGPDSTTYSLREGLELVIRHEDEVITLTPASPTVSRPTLKPLRAADPDSPAKTTRAFAGNQMKGTQLLHNLGQSLWLDNITRELLKSGTLQRYIDQYSVTGLTSNPTIFYNAVKDSPAYDKTINKSAQQGRPAEDIFFELALEDLTQAAELFRQIHAQTNGVDGWVSLELSPLLAYDTANSMTAARSLYKRAGIRNLMVKIPGTREGLPAIEAAIFAGVPVNVTLLFSPAQYVAAAEAFLRGIERRIDGGFRPDVGSVASLFVSRWDAAVMNKVPETLRGRLGIAIAKKTYKAYRTLLSSPRWQRIYNAGGRPQRLLWASTGTKDPSVSDVLYIKALAAPFTVNTMPEGTLNALATHSRLDAILPFDGGDCEEVLAQFAAAGIDIDALGTQLQEAGAMSFVQSWNDLMGVIASKTGLLRKVS